MDGTKFKQGVTSFRLVVPGFHGIGIEGKAPTPAWRLPKPFLGS
jgi:hypothetical protein